MASYIVRIYQGGEGGRSPLVGLLVEVDDEQGHPFRSREELWAILADLEQRPRPAPSGRYRKVVGSRRARVVTA